MRKNKTLALLLTTCSIGIFSVASLSSARGADEGEMSAKMLLEKASQAIKAQDIEAVQKWFTLFEICSRAEGGLLVETVVSDDAPAFDRARYHERQGNIEEAVRLYREEIEKKVTLGQRGKRFTIYLRKGNGRMRML